VIKHRLIYCTPFVEWWFDLDRAEGSFLWTKEGRRLIDFTSGWNTTNLGWNHPEVADAMIAQVRRNSYSAMWMAEDAQREYADMLTSALPEGLTAVGRATGGTEANEMAIKTARAFTGRKQVVGFVPTYHDSLRRRSRSVFPLLTFRRPSRWARTSFNCPTLSSTGRIAHPNRCFKSLPDSWKRFCRPDKWRWSLPRPAS